MRVLDPKDWIVGDVELGDCSSLTKVVMPRSFFSIGHKTFRGCNSLAEVVKTNDNFGLRTFRLNWNLPWPMEVYEVCATCFWDLLAEVSAACEDGMSEKEASLKQISSPKGHRKTNEILMILI